MPPKAGGDPRLDCYEKVGAGSQWIGFQGEPFECLASGQGLPRRSLNSKETFQEIATCQASVGPFPAFK